MKKYMILMLFTMVFMQVKAQTITSDTSKTGGDAILGVWKTDDQKAQITISRTDNLYNGKLSNATISVDKKPLLNLPTGLLGIYILRDFTFSGNNRWDGTIFDPKSKETYKCFLKLEDNGTMKVRGYKGISLFGKSQFWTKVN